jgi:hypothetical protein
VPDFILREEDFPIVIEGIDNRSGRVLWTRTIEKPRGRSVSFDVPEPDQENRWHVGVRMTYGDGEVMYTPPPTIQ